MNFVPICPYDGHCYRKNSNHFKEFAHPKQSFFKPQAQKAHTNNNNINDNDNDDNNTNHHHHHHHQRRQQHDDAKRGEEDEDEKDAPTPTPPRDLHPATTTTTASPHRRRSTSTEVSTDHTVPAIHTNHNHQNHDSDPQHIETAPPSPEQLFYYITHPPRPDLFTSPTTAAPLANMAVPLFSPTTFRGVATYLAAVYDDGTVYPEEDLRAVLLAAVRCRPSDPARAFPGCQLIGPLALALRQWRHLPQQQKQSPPPPHKTDRVDPSTASGAAVPVVRFRSAAAQWRYGRFRHDPIECQTVLLLETKEREKGKEKEKEGVSAREHVAYHRDEPTALPTMLVSYKDGYYRVAAHHLAPYLVARLAEQGATAEAAALRTAMKEVGASADAGADSSSTAELARAAHKARQRVTIAPTINGLGIVVPYNKTTELGYRPLTVSEARLKRILPAWDMDYALQLKEARQPQHPSKKKRTEVEEEDSHHHHHHHQSDHAQPRYTSPYTDTFRHAMEEQLCYLDMANDEGDFGLGLQLGQDIMGFIVTPTAPPPPPTTATTTTAATDREEEEEVASYNPLLWNAYRLLDTAYMCLNRGLYRTILRAHVPVLAGQTPVLLAEEEVFTVAHPH